MDLIWIVLLIGMITTLAIKRASLSVFSIAFAVYLTFLIGFNGFSATTRMVFLCLYALWLLFFQMVPIRQRVLTGWMLKIYRSSLPKMSLTEREALRAGDVGWTGDLFSGHPDWQKLLAMPKNTLSAEEQAFLAGPVEELCSMIRNWDINHRDLNIPDSIWQHLKQNGYFGLIIPKNYGGKQFSALAHSQIIAKIAASSVAVATVTSVPNSLGPAELLLHYGTEEQKNHYLPRLARGEEIPCFALTSPVAGSDASAIVDSGVICRGMFDGKEQIGIRLNWDKRYITLSPIATLLGLAFKLYDPEHLIGQQDEWGITCALIPVKTPGVVTGYRHYPLCTAFPNGPTQGRDVFIPLDWIIGGQKMAGQGWRMLMECLAAGRAISLPAMVSGGSKRAAYTSGAYARIREQFNLPIGAFGGVADAIAKIATGVYLIEATRLFTVSLVDQGLKPVVESAISKYHTTELARTTANHAMDVHGGKGICMGPHNYIGQNYMEGPVSITVEGANILTRSMIIFGQGAIRCHPYVLAEMEAAQNPNAAESIKAFDQVWFKHLGSIISNKTRAYCFGLSNGRGVTAPAGELKRYYQKLSRYSAAFAWVADMAMFILGGKLKREETLSARLGDVLSDLYLGSAVLKFYSVENNSEAMPIVKWLCEDLFYKIEHAFDQFFANFPVRWIAAIMRITIFPLGRCAKLPSDRLSEQVAQLIMQPSAVRARLAQHIYTCDDGHNPIGKIAPALQSVIETAPLAKKLHSAFKARQISGKNFLERVNDAVAKNILSSSEAQQLRAAEALRMDIVNVDAFSPEEFAKIR